MGSLEPTWYGACRQARRAWRVVAARTGRLRARRRRAALLAGL